MAITTPANIIKISESDDNLVEVQVGDNTQMVHFFFISQQERMKFYKENHSAVLTVQQLRNATQILQEMTEVNLSIVDVENLLDLYPMTRISTAVDGADGETLAAMVADYFLGTTWPKYGDKINIEKFVDILKQQAVRMGYSLVNL